MGERGGAAAIAALLAIVGLVLLVGGVRGTWLDVWHAITGKAGLQAPPPPESTVNQTDAAALGSEVGLQAATATAVSAGVQSGTPPTPSTSGGRQVK